MIEYLTISLPLEGCQIRDVKRWLKTLFFHSSAYKDTCGKVKFTIQKNKNRYGLFFD